MVLQSHSYLETVKKILRLYTRKENIYFMCFLPLCLWATLYANKLKIRASYLLSKFTEEKTGLGDFVRVYSAAKLLPILICAFYDIFISRVYAVCLFRLQKELFTLSLASRRAHAPEDFAKMHIKKAGALSSILYCLVSDVFCSIAFIAQAAFALYGQDVTVFLVANVGFFLHIVIPVMLFKYTLRRWLAFFMNKLLFDSTLTNSANNFDVIKAFGLKAAAAADANAAVGRFSQADYKYRLNTFMAKALFNMLEMVAVSCIVSLFCEGADASTIIFITTMCSDVHSSLNNIYGSSLEICTYFYFFHTTDNDPTYSQAGQQGTGSGDRSDNPPGESDIAIRMDSVSVGNTLQNISLTINIGEKVAIVGESGSGKTLLLSAIAGLVEHTGLIEVLGDSSGNPAHISYATQSVAYTTGTLMQNLKYGNSLSDEEIIAFCKKLGVHESFAKMTGGYNSVSATGGKNMSGGQRQRVHIARELLRGRPVLLLDTCLYSISHQDAASLLCTILADKSKTVIAVVDSNTQLRLFDKIIVLDDGRIHFGPYETIKPILKNLS